MYEKAGNDKKEEGRKEERKSLDEELAALKQSSRESKRAEASPFVEFETGCRGSVFLLSKEAKDITSEQPDELNHTLEGGLGTSGSAKKQRCDESSEGFAAVPQVETEASRLTDKKLEYKPSWEPLELVHKVFEDIRNEDDGRVPASRFVTRIIPMQGRLELVVDILIALSNSFAPICYRIS